MPTSTAPSPKGKAEKKPVLVYWGAKWCPPCNQLKATLFNRHDFIDRSRSFVPVAIDGDGPGAQKLGNRFKVRGYPTLILFNPDGSEITRLPGEADAPQVMKLLQQGLAGGRTVKAVLADARAGKPLSANEWRMLAFYAWDTDEARLVSEAERPGLLVQLAAACPPTEPDSAMRLMLKALAGSHDGKGVKPDAALRERVRRTLADAAAARSQMDVLVNWAPDIARALAPQPGARARHAGGGFRHRAGAACSPTATLSRADRMSAMIARVDLARLDLPKDALHPKLPESVRKQVRDEAAKADREITDPYERQAVVTAAAYLLSQAGLWKDSDALLKANLTKSHSPYYLMSQLGSNARKQGRKPPRRWTGTARPLPRAKARPPGCNGAPPTWRPWWTWRRRTKRASRTPPTSSSAKPPTSKAPSTNAAPAPCKRWAASWPNGTAPPTATSRCSSACRRNWCRCAASCPPQMARRPRAKA